MGEWRYKPSFLRSCSRKTASRLICWVTLSRFQPSCGSWIERRLRTLLRAVVFYWRFWFKARDAEVVHILAASWLNFLLVVGPAVVMGRLQRKRIILNYRGGDADGFLKVLRLVGQADLPDGEFRHCAFRVSGGSD